MLLSDPPSKSFFNSIGQTRSFGDVGFDVTAAPPSSAMNSCPAMESDRPDAIIVQPSLPTKRAAELALQHHVPAVSVPRWFADEGGLMSYSAIYVGCSTGKSAGWARL